MSKYTPGPWTWGDNYCGLYGSGPDNEVLTYERYEGMWVAFGDKQKANANLISAAPELLEALEYFMLLADKSGCGEYVQIQLTPEFFKPARKAIAKAKGEVK